MPGALAANTVTAPRAQSRDLRAGRVWGCWIAAFPIFDFLLRPSRGDMVNYSLDDARAPPPVLALALVLLLIAGFVPAFYSVRATGFNLNRGRMFIFICLALLATITASLFQVGSWSATASLAAITLTFVYAIILSGSNGSDDVARGMLQAIALGHIVILIMMIADSNYSYGRLMGRSGPNYWGTTATTLIFALIALRSRWLQAVGLAVAGATLILCQTRGSMIASFAGMIIVMMIWLSDNIRARLPLVLLGALFVSPVILLGTNYVLEKVLLLSNARRGLDSGGSGRAGAWHEAANLIAEHPLLGVGYRQSDAMMQTASSAHNAYLATGAELGLIGLTFYVIFLLGGMTRAIAAARRLSNGPSLAVAGFLTSYVVIGFLERRALNSGNAHSLAMIFCAAWAWRGRMSVREVL